MTVMDQTVEGVSVFKCSITTCSHCNSFMWKRGRKMMVNDLQDRNTTCTNVNTCTGFCVRNYFRYCAKIISPWDTWWSVTIRAGKLNWKGEHRHAECSRPIPFPSVFILYFCVLVSLYFCIFVFSKGEMGGEVPVWVCTTYSLSKSFTAKTRWWYAAATAYKMYFCIFQRRGGSCQDSCNWM